MEREEFKRQLDQLQQTIIDGLAYFHAWRGLMVEDESSARGLHRYRGFFLPALRALDWMALLEFAKVFDTHPRAVSFRRLLTEAKKYRQNLIPYATDESLREIGEKMAANEALLESLKRVRDERIAHYDPIRVRDSSVTPEPFLRLTEDVQSMYNLLLAGHNRHMTLFGSLSEDVKRHTDDLVRVLRERVEEH